MNEATMSGINVRRRVTAAGLALVLAVLSSATCLLGADASHTTMACCAAMSHDCGEMAVEMDCCAVVPAPSALSILASLIASLTPPPLVVISTFAQPEPSSPDIWLADSNIPKSPSRPTYLVVSVFRI
jgi:hypothetical protein